MAEKKKPSILATLTCAAIIPIASAVVIMFSDVQTIKQVKVDRQELADINLKFTVALEKHTMSLENLVNAITKLEKEHD